jgi:hypothetical protein
VDGCPRCTTANLSFWSDVQTGIGYELLPAAVLSLRKVRPFILLRQLQASPPTRAEMEHLNEEEFEHLMRLVKKAKKAGKAKPGEAEQEAAQKVLDDHTFFFLLQYSTHGR